MQLAAATELINNQLLYNTPAYNYIQSNNKVHETTVKQKPKNNSHTHNHNHTTYKIKSTVKTMDEVMELFGDITLNLTTVINNIT